MWEVGRSRSTCEADEQGRDSDRGAGGGKGIDQGEHGQQTASRTQWGVPGRTTPAPLLRLMSGHNPRARLGCLLLIGTVSRRRHGRHTMGLGRSQALPRIRFILVPHTGQVPLAIRRPLVSVTSPSKSRFSLHFTQYPL